MRFRSREDAEAALAGEVKRRLVDAERARVEEIGDVEAWKSAVLLAEEDERG